METNETKISERVCHVSDKITYDYIRDGIRADVCVPEAEHGLGEFDGNHYCLFHLPTKDKDAEKFEEKFRARLNAVEEKLTTIEALPEDEREQAKNRISYDFRYVWFPSDVKLINYEFLADAKFVWAAFSCGADFGSARFSASAYFGGAIFSADVEFIGTAFSLPADFYGAAFSADADFRWATFSARASFVSAKFSSNAEFGGATFSKEVDFSSATFSTNADFSRAGFSGDVDFEKTTFEESGQTSFMLASFAKEVFFGETKFRNEVNFNQARFETESEVDFQDTEFDRTVHFEFCRANGYVRFSELIQGEGFILNFREAAFKGAKRISFHTLQLRPNWFVDVDSRKFVLTDIDWGESLNSDFWNSNINAEFASLKERGLDDQGKRLLKVACRQLGANADENNRYEEASKFRQMAMEIEWLEKKEKIGNWIWNLDSESEKLKRRFGDLVFGSPVKHEDNPKPPLNSFGILRRSGDFVIHGLYRVTSFYGESWGWAALMLAIVIGISAFLYTRFDFYVCPQQVILTRQFELCETRELNAWEGIKQSFSVATLQRIEHRKPTDELVEWISIFEMILAPLQAALLALAIRRKFMR